MKLSAVVNFMETSSFSRKMMSFLLILNSLFIIYSILLSRGVYLDWEIHGFADWLKSLGILKLLDIPKVMLASALILLSFFMYMGARIAWCVSLILLVTIVFLDVAVYHQAGTQAYTSLALAIVLVISRRAFPHHSLTSAGFVAFICTISLLSFSMLGSLYIGDEFKPHITTLMDAFYFSIVCMTTLGFGDIVPISSNARMFTLTVVILGITVFTTSIVYVMGFLARGTRDIVKKRIAKMHDHFIIIGSSMLAAQLEKGLREQGKPVIAICSDKKQAMYDKEANIIEGDPTNVKTLQTANIRQASWVATLSESDAENTFILLTIQECPDLQAKLITIINKDENREKISRLRPDMLLSLASLGKEIMMKVLCGESINSSDVTDLLINKYLK
ncbi:MULTISPECIES: NAD-binding protein [Proteus]|uniref:Potassium channel protein n=8 Tax=Enterobacterales TaxID=91347 RepID=A0AAJ0YBW7_PROMI|nr:MULTISPECIES: NAD-binding protein [Proteus]NBN35561.1 potassium channel protein [Proteus sp. G4379]ARX33949.1 potassium channel protein [Proteus mirabilis]AVB31176.1 potassium channel protein [Proteus mirabilis]EEI48503.1 TrkA N-terminal domain protein [Proteus mirabilis ATCC 29906]EJD6315041.1 NAD-binding protein [Proteus mirabilis]